MKLAIIQCINGNFSIAAEGITTEQAALTSFHNRCMVLWNATDVITAEVAVVDEQLDIYHNYKEFIHHEQSEPEPEPEQNTDIENE